jgi:antitoxin component YwqK of YwqJK toxin-antitoxin module
MKKLILSASLLAAFAVTNAQQTYTANYPNGTKQVEGQYNSAVTISNDDSKEVQAQKMANAIQIGKWTYWHENGQVAAENHYSNTGVMIGNWKGFYKDGKKELDINFTTGAAQYWYNNGQLFEEGKMLPGMIKEGNWKTYYDNGKINVEGAYVNGQKNGQWKFYDQQGKLYFVEVWNNGQKAN